MGVVFAPTVSPRRSCVHWTSSLPRLRAFTVPRWPPDTANRSPANDKATGWAEASWLRAATAARTRTAVRLVGDEFIAALRLALDGSAGTEASIAGRVSGNCNEPGLDILPSPSEQAGNQLLGRQEQ